ncbi:MAG: DUF4271 domain-containing protein [Bacteroidetes bacterium]|nr:DUF4271 domain-containing protein [Bacteroidota bacterium]
MNDSLLNYFNVVGVNDTFLVNHDSIICDSITQPIMIDFLQMKSSNIVPVVLTIDPIIDIITYSLIILLGLIAIIWHFMPDRFSMIFSLKLENQLSRSGGDANIKVPGTLITGVFWLNFIVSAGIFILILLQNYYPDGIVGLSSFEILGYIYLATGSLLLYRIIVIYSTSIIFQTQKMRKQQVVTSRNIFFITGVILVPVILLILYIKGSIIMYLALLAIAFLQVVRLMKIMIIGKSNTMFSTLHIILYLCTLEIVPILVLIRMISNSSGVV